MSTPTPSRGRVAAPEMAPRGAATQPEDTPRRRGLEVGLVPLVLSILGTILVCAVIALVVLSGRDDAEPVATHTSAATDVVAISGTPTVDPTLSGIQVIFEVSYPELAKGDRLQVVVGNAPDAIDESQTVTLPSGVTRHAVSVGPGVTLCAKARVVRGLATSAWSGAECEVQK